MLLNKLGNIGYVLIFMVIFSFVFRQEVHGQQIDNLRLEQVKDKIIIHYDFVSGNLDATYQLKVYQSTDGFLKAINLVKGDIGDKVSPGNGKTIEWYAREELGAFKGPLMVEIRVFESPENIYIQHPVSESKFKTSKLANISWSGGINVDKVTIRLFSDGKQVQTLANSVDNTGKYEWTVPKKIKPGKKYAIQITGDGSDKAISTSGEFTIKKNIPIWLVAVPVVVVGGVVAVLLSRPPDPGNENLPGAPDPN